MGRDKGGVEVSEQSVKCVLVYPMGGEGWEQQVSLPSMPREGDSILIPEEQSGTTSWANDLLGESFTIKRIDWRPSIGDWPSMPPLLILRNP